MGEKILADATDVLEEEETGERTDGRTDLLDIAPAVSSSFSTGAGLVGPVSPSGWT